MLLALGRLSYPSQHACSIQSSSLQRAQPALHASSICSSAQTIFVKALDVRRVVLLRMQRLELERLTDLLSKLRSRTSAAEEIAPVGQSIRFGLSPEPCE